jgi:hypothetical protein
MRAFPSGASARHRQGIGLIVTALFYEWSKSSQRTSEAKASILHQRLYSWKQKWEQDPTWPPWNSQVHGAHHRSFIVAEERALSHHISDNSPVPGRLFTDTGLIEIATMAFLEKHHDKGAISEFPRSPWFISDFKKQNRFSSRRAHLKRRPTVQKMKRCTGSPHYLNFFALYRTIKEASMWMNHAGGAFKLPANLATDVCTNYPALSPRQRQRIIDSCGRDNGSTHAFSPLSDRCR